VPGALADKRAAAESRLSHASVGPQGKMTGGFNPFGFSYGENPMEK